MRLKKIGIGYLYSAIIMSIAIGWILVLVAFPALFKGPNGHDTLVRISAYLSILFCFVVYLTAGLALWYSKIGFRWRIIYILIGLAATSTYGIDNVIRLSLWSAQHVCFVDFPSFYFAAKAALQKGDMYDPVFVSSLVAPYRFIIYPFLYHPVAILLFVPFLFFDYFVAQNLFLALSHAVIPLFIYYAYRSIAIFRKHKTLFFLVTCVTILMYAPFYFNFYCGQVNTIVQFVVMGMYVLYKRSRYNLAGACLGLGIVLKQWPVLFLPFFILTGDIKIVMYALAVFALFTIVSILMFGVDSIVSYLAVIASLGYTKIPTGLCSPASPVNQSFNAFFSRLFVQNEFSIPLIENPLLGKILCYITGIAIGAVTLISNRNSLKTKESVRDAKFNLIMVAAFLISPFGWQHHLVWVFIPCIFTFISLVVFFRRGQWMPIILCLVAYILIAFPLYMDRSSYVFGKIVYLIVSSHRLYGAILMWALLIYIETRCAASKDDRSQEETVHGDTPCISNGAQKKK